MTPEHCKTEPIQQDRTRAAAATPLEPPWCPCWRTILLPGHGLDGASSASPRSSSPCTANLQEQPRETLLPSLCGKGAFQSGKLLATNSNLSCFLSPCWLCRTSVLSPVPACIPLHVCVCAFWRSSAHLLAQAHSLFCKLAWRQHTK